MNNRAKVVVLLRLVGVGFLLWGFVALVQTYTMAENVRELTSAASKEGASPFAMDPFARSLSHPNYTFSLALLTVGLAMLVKGRDLAFFVFSDLGETQDAAPPHPPRAE